MKKLKRTLIFFLICLSLLFLTIWGLHIYIIRDTNNRIYGNIADVPSFHTVIILGASVHSDGKLSPILQDRVDTGLSLYRSGKAKRFLLSGDNRRADYNEVNAMRNYLLARNVPENHILMDPAGIDTYDSMYRSRAIFKVYDAIVVTQEFHLPRTLFIAKNLGFNYYGYPAVSNRYKTESSLRRREKLANFKALYEVLSNQVPVGTKAAAQVTGK
jgi:SanA protein